jgi:hypothetical protein
VFAPGFPEVHVDIDQARRHHEPPRVDLPSALGRIDPFANFGNDSLHNQNILNGVDRLAGVDDPSAPDQ